MNKRSYNKICDLWSEYRFGQPINKCIVDFVKYLKPNSKILDIGCGSGYPIDKYLDDLNFAVCGIDISDKMILKSKALNLKNANFLNIDIMEYNSNEVYDAIIAFDSLFHLSMNQQALVYDKISSLLKNDGYLLFTHGKNKSQIIGKMFNEEFYYSALDKDELINILNNNGFSIIELYEDYKEETTGDRELLIIAKKAQV